MGWKRRCCKEANVGCSKMKRHVRLDCDRRSEGEHDVEISCVVYYRDRCACVKESLSIACITVRINFVENCDHSI